MAKSSAKVKQRAGWLNQVTNNEGHQLGRSISRGRRGSGAISTRYFKSGFTFRSRIQKIGTRPGWGAGARKGGFFLALIAGGRARAGHMEAGTRGYVMKQYGSRTRVTCNIAPIGGGRAQPLGIENRWGEGPLVFHRRFPPII